MILRPPTDSLQTDTHYYLYHTDFHLYGFTCLSTGELFQCCNLHMTKGGQIIALMEKCPKAVVVRRWKCRSVPTHSSRNHPYVHISFSFLSTSLSTLFRHWLIYIHTLSPYTVTIAITFKGSYCLGDSYGKAYKTVTVCNV